MLAHEESDGRLAWFAAREARHEIAGYADDLRLLLTHCIAAAQRSPDSEQLALLTRYALLYRRRCPTWSAPFLRRSRLSLFASASGPVKRRSIVPLRADAGEAVLVVREALRANTRSTRPDLVELAVTRVEEIEDPDARVGAITALVDDLPSGAEDLAVELLRRIENEGFTSRRPPEAHVAMVRR